VGGGQASFDDAVCDRAGHLGAVVGGGGGGGPVRGWATVGSAVQQAVSYGLSRRELGKVLYIGVDEVSREKGHVYQTVVYDFNQKLLLWTGDGNGKETLERFFREWGAERTGQLTAICCDMWTPYVEVIRSQAPRSTGQDRYSPHGL